MNENTVSSPKCPNCGATFRQRAGTCEYCGSFVERYKGPQIPDFKIPVMGDRVWASELNNSCSIRTDMVMITGDPSQGSLWIVE